MSRRWPPASTPPQARWISGYFAGLDAGPAARRRRPRRRRTAAPAGGRSTILYGTETGNARDLGKALAAAAARARARAAAVRHGRLQGPPAEGRAGSARHRQHLWRGRSAAAGDRLLRVPRRPQARPSSRTCATRCSRSAIRPTSNIARPASGSTAASRSSARRGSPTASTATSIMTSRRRHGAARWSTGSAAELAERSAEIVPRCPPLPQRRPGGAGLRQAQSVPGDRARESLRITGRDSTKETRHVELDLAGSGLAYEPGDALGVVAANDPARGRRGCSTRPGLTAARRSR